MFISLNIPIIKKLDVGGWVGGSKVHLDYHNAMAMHVQCLQFSIFFLDRVDGFNHIQFFGDNFFLH